MWNEEYSKQGKEIEKVPDIILLLAKEFTDKTNPARFLDWPYIHVYGKRIDFFSQ